MTAAFSIYLDLIRFLAAFAVLLDHLAAYPFSKGLVYWRLGSYANVAVMIFFLLSGYVIAYVSSTRERTVKDYTISRLARLYSVTVIALLLTCLFDRIGMYVNPDFYAIPKVLPRPPSWDGYLSSLLFLNEYQIFGLHGKVSPGSNQPFWSLSFEATYYAVAGLLLFAPRRFAYAISLLLLGFAGIKIAILLPMWFIGYFLYQTKDRFKFGTRMSLIIFPLSTTLILLIPNLSAHFPNDIEVVQDCLTALGFSLNVLSARQLLGAQLTVRKQIKSGIRWLGTLTFPLYAIHYPALCLFTAISPWPLTTWANALFTTSSVLVLVGVLTPLCDSLKVKMHHWIAIPGSS
jgi:peptidoglycan/LPS O-acetylase OafA/YrhL